MIDLHIHTSYSDGTDDTITILKKAEKRKLDFISITDHNTCMAYNELRKINISEYYCGKIITGCEFTTTWNGRIIEILGYDINTEWINENINKYYYSFEDKQLKEYSLLLKKLDTISAKFNKENFKFDPKKDSSRKTIHTELTKYEENRSLFADDRVWNDLGYFSRRCVFNPDSIFYINQEELFPKIDDVLDIIKNCGGKSFLAHVYEYGVNENEILNSLVFDYGIDGIECYYSTFTDNQINYLINYCNQNNLYACGGNDYHGENKKGIEIGIGRGNMSIPNQIIRKWAK